MKEEIDEKTLSVAVTLSDVSPIVKKKVKAPQAAKEMPTTEKILPPTKKTGADKITSFAMDVIQSPQQDDLGNKILRINDFSDIMTNLEHRLAQLKIVLSSPHIGNFKERAEILLGTVLQLVEMVGLLHNCQTKVCNDTHAAIMGAY